MASLLRIFVSRFANGELPTDLLAYSAFVLVYPVHKKLPEERASRNDPALRQVLVLSVLVHFGCKVFVRMNRVTVAE